MTGNEIATKVIGIAIELHKKLGPGLLESAYENAFAYDLRDDGFLIQQQVFGKWQLEIALEKEFYIVLMVHLVRNG